MDWLGILHITVQNKGSLKILILKTENFMMTATIWITCENYCMCLMNNNYDLSSRNTFIENSRWQLSNPTDLEIQLLWSKVNQHSLVSTAPCNQLHIPGRLLPDSVPHMKSQTVPSSWELLRSSRMHIQSYNTHNRTHYTNDIDTLSLHVAVMAIYK
jgi:hypothetical protein